MSAAGSEHKVYRFGQFALDERSAELSGRTGRIPLRPQSFEVLRLLVANHNRLVSKEELYARIWGNRAVTDDSLAQCLIDIRRALGDSRRKVIRTVPRRGYMFSGDVQVTAAGAPLTAIGQTKPRRGRAVVAAAICVALLVVGAVWVLGPGGRPPGSAPMENSVAVLPFLDLSVRQEQQYLGDGLSEDILSSLGQYPALRVIARTSSFSLAARSADVRQIRDALNVAYVLEGSVRRSGDQVQVVAKLIDATDSTQVWTHTYQVSRQELFTIHQSIAAGVAQRIAPGVPALAADTLQTSFTAADLMWLGRRFEREVKGKAEVDRVALDSAIHYYREATLADPDSALAHSRLAGALLYGGDVIEARTAALRALELDPDLSEVQETLGAMYFALNMIEEAGTAWQRAIELNPSNVDALGAYASWYWFQTDGDAEEYFRRALELDPLNLARYADLGYYVGSHSRAAATAEVLQWVRERFDGPEAFHVLARLSDFAGRIDESIAWTIRARNAEPDNAMHTAALAELLVDIGDDDSALALQPQPGIGSLLKMRRYEEVIEEAELLMIDEPDDIHLRYVLAFAYNAVGRHGDAVRVFGELGMLEPAPARLAIDFGARVTLAEALAATGHASEARDNAQWWLDEVDLTGDDWWNSVYGACSLAILGEYDEALEWLERLPGSARLAHDYVLRDSSCFDRFLDNERYQRVLADFDARRAAIRKRLPRTIEAFGVAL